MVKCKWAKAYAVKALFSIITILAFLLSWFVMDCEKNLERQDELLQYGNPQPTKARGLRNYLTRDPPYFSGK